MEKIIEQSFLFNEEIIKQLEELSEEAQLSTTAILIELIEERYNYLEINKELNKETPCSQD